MYTVKEWHCRPTYRRGDLGAEEVISMPLLSRQGSSQRVHENKLSGKHTKLKEV